MRFSPHCLNAPGDELKALMNPVLFFCRNSLSMKLSWHDSAVLCARTTRMPVTRPMGSRSISMSTTRIRVVTKSTPPL